MKYLIPVLMLFVFATSVSASTVAINEITVSGCGAQTVVISGVSVYTEDDTTTVITVDDVVVQVSEDTEWSVSYEATIGTHEIVATVGSASDTSSFTIPSCGGGDPMNAPCFSELGPQSCGQKLIQGLISFVAAGEQGNYGVCEWWFPAGCLEIVPSAVPTSISLNYRETSHGYTCEYLNGCVLDLSLI